MVCEMCEWPKPGSEKPGGTVSLVLGLGLGVHHVAKHLVSVFSTSEGKFLYQSNVTGGSQNI